MLTCSSACLSYAIYRETFGSNALLGGQTFADDNVIDNYSVVAAE